MGWRNYYERPKQIPAVVFDRIKGLVDVKLDAINKMETKEREDFTQQVFVKALGSEAAFTRLTKLGWSLTWKKDYYQNPINIGNERIGKKCGDLKNAIWKPVETALNDYALQLAIGKDASLADLLKKIEGMLK